LDHDVYRVGILHDTWSRLFLFWTHRQTERVIDDISLAHFGRRRVI